MPFIPAVNTAQVILHQQLHGQTVQNVFYVQNATVWGSSDLAALCNLVISWWNDSLADELHSDMHLVSVSARDMTTADAAGVEIQAPPLSGGNLNTGGGMPGNVALVIKFKSGLTGRNRNGRFFLAGMSEESVNGNTITDAIRDQILLDFGELRDSLIGAGYEPVVASFYDGTELVTYPSGEVKKRPVARSTALLTPIEQYTADTNLDSQRRRLAGRGV